MTLRTRATWFARIVVATGSLSSALAGESTVPRKDLLRQPAAWYATSEARTLADNIVAQQSVHGGWTNWSNEGGMMRSPTAADAPNLVHASLDDGATTTQLRFLAHVLELPGAATLTAARAVAYRSSFLRGFDYLLTAQYPNGGWPHRYPAQGYHAHITFNDDTTYNVIALLRTAVAGDPLYAWVDTPRRQRAAAAVKKGVECILASQVVIDGRKTAWGAQHDAKTLAPTPARTFEPASLCGSESVGLVRLLMEIEEPSPEVIAAVRGAVSWFEQVKIAGLRSERFQTPEGFDTRVVPDQNAPALWARFYELGTNRPIFAGRDAVIKYSLAEIERERRGGYGWYTDRPRKLLEVEYPRWAKRWVRP